jgi:hypothetical protein
MVAERQSPQSACQAYSLVVARAPIARAISTNSLGIMMIVIVR